MSNIWKSGYDEPITDQVFHNLSKTIAGDVFSTWQTVNKSFDIHEPIIEMFGKAIVDFDDLSEYAENYAQARAGALVTELNRTQKQVVKTVTANAIKYGWSDAEIAKRLQGKIGLNTRYAIAVDNYYNNLLEKNVAKGEALRLMREYEKRLKWTRALSIAKTEVQRAFVQGQRTVWRELRKSGDISNESKAIWVLHKSETACPFCRNLMNKRHEIDGPVAPPLHPNCRCWEELVDSRGRLIKSFRRTER